MKHTYEYDIEKYLTELFNNPYYKQFIQETPHIEAESFDLNRITKIIEEWYKERKHLDNQGILIEGKWGVGKTSFIKAFQEEYKKKKREISFVYLNMAQLIYDNNLFKDIKYFLFKENLLNYIRSLITPPIKGLLRLTVLLKNKYILRIFLIIILISIYIHIMGFTVRDIIAYIIPLLFASPLLIKVYNYFTGSYTLQQREFLEIYTKKYPIIFIIDEIDILPKDKFATFMDTIRTILNIPNIFYIFLWDEILINNSFTENFNNEYYNNFLAKNTSFQKISIEYINILSIYLNSSKNPIINSNPVIKNILLSKFNNAEELHKDINPRKQKNQLRDKLYNDIIEIYDINISNPLFHKKDTTLNFIYNYGIHKYINNIEKEYSLILTLDSLSIEEKNDIEEKILSEYIDIIIETRLNNNDEDFMSYNEEMAVESIFQESYNNFIYTIVERLFYMNEYKPYIEGYITTSCDVYKMWGIILNKVSTNLVRIEDNNIYTDYKDHITQEEYDYHEEENIITGKEKVLQTKDLNIIKKRNLLLLLLFDGGLYLLPLIDNIIKILNHIKYTNNETNNYRYIDSDDYKYETIEEDVFLIDILYQKISIEYFDQERILNSENFEDELETINNLCKKHQLLLIYFLYTSLQYQNNQKISTYEIISDIYCTDRTLLAKRDIDNTVFSSIINLLGLDIKSICTYSKEINKSVIYPEAYIEEIERIEKNILEIYKS